MLRLGKFLIALTLVASVLPVVSAQDKSVRPGINDTFRDPNPKEFLGKFEVESREETHSNGRASRGRFAEPKKRT